VLVDFTKIVLHQFLLFSIAHGLILSFQKLLHPFNSFESLPGLLVVVRYLRRDRPQRVFPAQLNRRNFWLKTQLFVVIYVLLEALLLYIPIPLFRPVLIPFESLN